MKPEFLGWDRPLLPVTVDYFLNHYVRERRLDLEHVVLALPGRRAINRLEELFVERVDRLVEEGRLEPDWYPPQFLTLGTLPECFYERGKPIADELTQCFTWIEVVERMRTEQPEQLKFLIPRLPDREDLEARIALGKMLARLHRELAADALDFGKVADYCRKFRLDSEQRRWETLSTLQEQYHRVLDSLDIWDLQSARLFAIEHQRPDEYRRIVERLETENRRFFLVGLVDMNSAQKEILRKFERYVTPLVFAPESLSDRFDSFGCLVPDAWSDVPLEIDDRQIDIVRHPGDQADAVLRKIAALDGRYAAEEIVVGVPDPQVVPYVRQRLDQAGIRSRHFEGTPMKRTAVYRFLEVLLRFIETRNYSAFAELVRHPDVQRFLESDPALAKLSVDLLSVLDRYHEDVLPADLSFDAGGPFNPKHSHAGTLQSIWNRLNELLGDLLRHEPLEAKAPILDWSGKINAIFERLYGDDEDELIPAARKQVDAVTEMLLAVPDRFLFTSTFAETLRLILLQIRKNSIPPHDVPNAIELIGWLEIVMDDVPVAIVTGMNDGFVPSFLTSDMFLPDKVRRYLHIEDNRRRFARDAYSLSVILATRAAGGEVRLIGGRRSPDGDPMLPSRLFFSSDDETVARRVQRFFSESPEQVSLLLTGSPRPGREKDSLFRIPPALSLDRLPGGPPRSMRVTEFADYLRCPYRYYLKHLLKLESLEDTAEELHGGRFGTVVHEVVRHLRNAGMERETNPDTIRFFLEKKLREYTVRAFGDTPRAAVSIQIERAWQRLQAFADWQADWAGRGHRIVDTEFSFDEKSAEGNVFLEVDGKKMFLRGRIDRIDYNDRTHRLTILDYKTSDTAVDPESTHRKKDGDGGFQWVDFQLPLYHYIIRRADYVRRKLKLPDIAGIDLCYISLPKDVDQIREQAATWIDEEIGTAIEAAEKIVADIWAERFDPVDPPPKYSESFAAICLDNVLK